MSHVRELDSASGWSATPSWARPTPRPGARRGRFFDLPLQPDLAVLCGRDAAKASGGRGEAGLAVGRDRLESSCSSRDDVAAGRRLHARRHARRDRDRRAGRRQARAVREAAGQHRRRGARDGRRGRAGRGRRACAAWSASTTGGCPRWRWPGGWSSEGRIGEIRHVRAQYLQDWIVDPEFPLVWRLQAEHGRVGRAGRHRRAHRRHGAVPHRRPAHRGLGADRDVRAGAAAARGVERAGRVRRHRARDRSTSTTRRCSSAASPAGAVASFEATRFATGRKNALRIELNGSARVARVRPRADERAGVLRRRRGPRHRRVPPHPGHRADPPVRGRVVAAGARARLRALVHPPGRGPGHATSARAATRRRRSPTGCRCSWCSTRSSARPRRAAAGTTSGEEADGATDHACSPASGPTCRSRRSRGWRGSGATTGWRSPAGATTSTRGPRSRTTPTSAAAARSWTSTACRSSRSPTTSPARPSATTRSTSGTGASCPPGSGATASPRACGSGRPRRCR